ncbi:MAG: hypothetical protein HY553_02520 [Elusimicrobia bacterium]|nr:hypothetical protein [Elusimicrobiota bacterium]
MTRLAAAALLLAWSSAPAAAFKGDAEARRDAQRFGLDRPEPAARPRQSKYAPQAVVRLDQLKKLGGSVRYSPAGTVSAVVGPIPARGGPPEQAARGFLGDYREALELDPSSLVLVERKHVDGRTHLLFRQTHEGLPVEFARVKVHLGPEGEVLALHTSHQAGIAASPLPKIAAAAAAAAVASDLGRAAPEGGSLVYLPVYKTGEVRLAWKFKIGGGRAIWYYYVDAENGEVLFRYNDMRYQACPSGTSGTVTGEVFDIDPQQTPVQTKGMPHQKVWQFSTQLSTYAVTNANGFFCNSGTAAKIVTALQGPYVAVSNFSKASMHFDNGNGRWNTVVTPVASPSPYANGSKFPNSVVFDAAFNNPPFTDAMAQILRFDFFQVGAQDVNGDITDDDQVHVYDSEGKRVASYIGNRQPFNSAPAYGCLTCAQNAGRDPMRVQLQANQSIQGLGFRVNVSSYLILQDAPAVAANPSNVAWTDARAADGSRDEMNLFYHLNGMYDYFMADVNKSSAAWISSGVVAMAHFGPNLGNAFYDPDHNNFGFGDLGGGIALDATVTRHEFAHFAVDKIYPIVNFGQNGAISEALADYFSASSLNVPSIGRFVGSSFGTESALRELACVQGGSPACSVFPNNWVGEIHDDDLPLAQALWEVRQDLRATLGAAPGRSCADGLIWKAIFFFPDSFQEFLDAMLLVDAGAGGGVAACGGANTARTTILNRFANHGITQQAGLFVYEPNDGTQSAVDITTLGVVTAALFPPADLDYFTFASGPGPIVMELDLPPIPGGGAYFHYGLMLFDGKLRQLAEAFPPNDVNSTLSGGCPNVNCQTTFGRVTLNYDNPAANQFYLLVTAGLTDLGSNGATSSPTPYSIKVAPVRIGAFSGSVVEAKLDQDRIDFTVNVSSFVTQNLRFSHAQLRDHRLGVIGNTRADCVPTASFAGLQNCPGGPTNSNGRITGSIRMQNFGGQTFSQRYPSLGTVFLEVFAFNELQFQARQFPGAGAAQGTPQSLGLSSPMNLGSGAVLVTPYNNLFNPAKGQATTIKYEVQSPGRVRLRLFSKTGALVKTLIDGDMPAGKGSIDWDGRNLAGQVVASGIYQLRLEGPNGANVTHKVVVVK